MKQINILRTVIEIQPEENVYDAYRHLVSSRVTLMGKPIRLLIEPDTLARLAQEHYPVANPGILDPRQSNHPYLGQFMDVPMFLSDIDGAEWDMMAPAPDDPDRFNHLWGAEAYRSLAQKKALEKRPEFL